MMPTGIVSCTPRPELLPPSDRLTGKYLTLLVGLLALAGGCMNPPAARLPARQYAERIWIDSEINGTPLRLAFDTGTSVPVVLTGATMKRLGLSVVPGPTELSLLPPGARWSKAASVKFMGRSYSDVDIAVLDPPPGFPTNLDGLIGFPAFADHNLSFVVSEGRIGVVREALSAAAYRDWNHLLVRTDSGALTLAPPRPNLPWQNNLPAAATDGSLLIDTGNPEGVELAPEEWARWRAAHATLPATMNSYYTPLAGLVIREMVWADELTLDGIVLHGVPVREASRADVQAVGTGYLATLGLYALKRTDLVIDGAKKIAFLKPRSEPGMPYPHNRLGAVFVPEDDKSDRLIAHVATGSPADLAGIRNGDLLLKIGAVDVTAWRSHPEIEINHRFIYDPAGTRLTLTVQRGEERLTVTAVLRDILGPTDVSGK